MGSVAYIACLRFVSPLVVAVVMSSEPIVSGVIATMLHFDQPDAWTAAGGAILIGGCLLVVWSERERKVKYRYHGHIVCMMCDPGIEQMWHA